MEPDNPMAPPLLVDIRNGVMLPHQSIDCVILAYDAPHLKVLLLKWKGEDAWVLPGGFIKKTEHFDEAASRILKERTGLEGVFLNQFKTFSNPRRNDMSSKTARGVFDRMAQSIPIAHREDLEKWLKQRFISTAYFSLIDIQAAKPQPDFLSEDWSWSPVNALPDLMLDHQEIFAAALEYLKIRINHLPIGLSLLPEKFTMRELQSLYEAILQRPLVRSNFQRKMLALKMLIRHEKRMTGAANKAPYQYSFDQVAYFRLLKEGIGF